MEHGHSVDEIKSRILDKSNRTDLRDFVYGSIDGTITTFAIVAGVEGANLSSTIIIALGIANVLADGFSMAASNYSGTKTELDDMHRLRQIEKRHIKLYPDGEREEIRQILKLKGLKGDVLEGAVDAITSNHERWIDLMMIEEYGILPEKPEPLRAAIITFFAFVVCGLIPLASYIIGLGSPFVAAIVATGATFFGIGALKSRWSLQHWLWSGFETLLIGGVAAGLAYFVGALFAA
ncbi:VIT1/CCC1 transporter family protein [Lentilitoribacter sp. EG35]|uniref:VIT1/CCC1 transporter family protein n=1 Tax=Lentilitoribacter sp. EG35 TaxID=3234192 RepID=UPI0034606A91